PAPPDSVAPPIPIAAVIVTDPFGSGAAPAWRANSGGGVSGAQAESTKTAVCKRCAITTLGVLPDAHYLMRSMVRRAGVVIPLFSIRAAGGRDWGLGEIPDLARFSEWAARADLGVVQILPVNEPSGGQASPYSARTAFGIDPTYIALEEVEDFQAAGGVAALPAPLRTRLDAARESRSVRWEDIRAVKTEAL